MTKMVVLIGILTASVVAFAHPAPSARLARSLYPESREDQAFTAQFFEIVESHKTNDPLLGGRGPSIHDYRLDRTKFAFMTNETATTIDLVIFNWDLAVFEGLEISQDLSELYGSKVYILKRVDKKSVASQGEGGRELTNFSYVMGSRYSEMKLKKDYPNYQVPDSISDWKPHSDYMPRSHPLRKTLDTSRLPLLSPKQSYFYSQFGLNNQNQSAIKSMIQRLGGFYNVIMGTMIHEIFHVKEGDDQVSHLATERPFTLDVKSLIEDLRSDSKLKATISAYIKIVFSIGEELKKSHSTAREALLLSELRTVISDLKLKSPKAWSFIWEFEYKEGFAEYVSAYSLIQAQIISQAQKIDLEILDGDNNFTYRTGTLGGLFLANRLHVMPFENEEDHRESVWEIILRLTPPSVTNESIEEILSKYQKNAAEGDREIELIFDYIKSIGLNPD